MSTFWSRYFGKGDEGLFGKPFRLLSGAPSAKRGQLRPGRLSTAAIKALAANKSQQRLPPAGGAPKPGLPAPPSGAPKPGMRLPPPPGNRAQGPTAPPQSPRTPPQQLPPPPGNRVQGPTAPQSPRNQLQRRGALQTFAKSQLRGLGDVDIGQGKSLPFVGNAQVWVSVQQLPLRGLDDNGGPGPYVNWPDGTPVVGSFWLPKLDLSADFDPRINGSWWQGDDPLTRKWGDGRDKRQLRGAGWIRSEAAAEVAGALSWEWLIDYGAGRAENGFNGQFPEPPTGQLFSSLYYYTLVDGVDRSLTDWQGHNARINRWANSFEWSKNPPAVQAPVYLWLNLYNPQGVAYTVQEAEIYRADLQDVATAGEPTALPGAAWLCLDVLDAMVTGAHGMPVMVRTDGTLDRAVFTAFLQAHPEWVPLLSFGRNNAGMLAIVNDLGVVGGEVVNVPKPPPPPATSPTPRGGARGFGPPAGNSPPPPPADAPPPPRQPDDPGTFRPGGSGGNDVNPFGPPSPPEYLPPPFVPPPTGSGGNGPDDDYMEALIELLLYLLSLDADDFWRALLLLDDDTLAIVVYVLEFDSVLAA